MFVHTGMTPLWIHFLGGKILEGTKIKFPIQNVFLSLATLTIPVVIGMLLTRFLPKVSDIVGRYLKWFMISSGSVFFAVLLYVYWYMLPLMSFKLISSCLILSACGYVLGYLIAAVFKQGRNKNITISIETGFQNVAMSLFLLNVTFQHPESDISSLVPITYAVFGSAIPSVAYFIYSLKNFILKWKRKDSGPTYEKFEMVDTCEIDSS